MLETKVCSKCGEEKNITLFSKSSRSKDGHITQCKICRSKIELEYRLLNKEKVKKRRKTYYENNKKKHLKYFLERRNNDTLFKVTDNVRRRMNHFFKSNYIQKNNKTFNIIGCSPQSLREHLESQFVKGMNWDNYGKDGWHIDHIIPLSSANNEDEIYELCNYSNLQPLWAKENLSKGSKIL